MFLFISGQAKLIFGFWCSLPDKVGKKGEGINQNIKKEWEYNFLLPVVTVSSQFSTSPQNTSFPLHVVNTSRIPTTPFVHDKSQFSNTKPLPLLQTIWGTPVSFQTQPWAGEWNDWGTGGPKEGQKNISNPFHWANFTALHYWRAASFSSCKTAFFIRHASDREAKWIYNTGDLHITGKV